MTVTLQTIDLAKTYQGESGEIQAVAGVSIELRQGEFVALVGPSGSGKTTLLAMLAGLLSPTAGRILIDGRELGNMREADRVRFRRERIGFTFQANNLVPYLTALENVELMLRLNRRLDKASRQRAKDILARLGLGDRLNSLPAKLSGGQQQRVAIARALVHEPAVVLADEPTASLDTERAFQVVETFAELIHEQGRAGIMVTHDLRMVQFVDRVIQMLDGAVVRVVEDRQHIQRLSGTAYAALREAAGPAASANGAFHPALAGA
jgi:putative ABC transport system ATP-binding protein